MDVPTTKPMARRHARRLVTQMGDADRRRESADICKHLPTSGRILAFAPLIQWEPDIRPLLKQLDPLILPRVTDRGLTLHRCAWVDLVRMPRYGLLEPPHHAPQVDPVDIETVWVPGWAFDHTGARLGKGGGYYDRLLPKTKARRLGICFSRQVWTTLPTAPHDVSVHAIVTPSGIMYVPPSSPPNAPTP